MTIIGLLMLVVFGFLAVRHFLGRRYVWAILASLGSLLGAGSLWVDYQRASNGASDTEVSSTPSPETSQSAPAIGDYQPPTGAGSTSPATTN